MHQKEYIQIINAVSDAGKAILDIYQSDDWEIETKLDNTPLTNADKAAHNILVKSLGQFNIPILSEEGKHIDFAERKKWREYWLIDPLDGTKEFIKRNGEFTINVAKIIDGEPFHGFVYAPVLKTFYVGLDQKTAIKFTLEAGEKLKEWPKERSVLKVQKPTDRVVVVGSRSHFNEKTEKYINDLRNKYSQVDFIAKGSSLKLVEVAEGKAHIYPRFGPTMEWDTAAAHAVVIAAGGKVETPEQQALKYNKENLLNPYFVVEAI
jgi:3'(2'), 5'-bisphosphate nucleotidase